MLNQLKRAVGGYGHSLNHFHSPAVVLLCTPSFATWLDDQRFIPSVLENIFSEDNELVLVDLEVSILAAVVDGLPPIKLQGQPIPDQTSEGFAFLTGNRDEILPGLWNGHESQSRQSQHEKSNVTFSFPIVWQDKSDSHAFDITVPLSNTMFRNGRISTLLASKWQKTDDLKLFVNTQHNEKQSQRIVLEPRTLKDGKMPIPLTPLTPWREIKSGLGNIVRQLANEDGESVPASNELETSVVAYLKTRGLPQQTVSVWAIVLPGDNRAEHVKQVVHSQNGHFRKDRQARWTDPLTSESPWNTIRLGGTLHRICESSWLITLFSYSQSHAADLFLPVSGGGGWGSKQGLLALDPETTVAQSTDARFDFEHDDSMGNIAQTRALGEIAKPGSYIQFWIAHDLPGVGTDMNNKPSNPNETCPALGVSSFSFGCIPSTIDDIPSPSAEPNKSSKEGSGLAEFHGHFGAQSEHGIFLHFQIPGEQGLERESTLKTKMDVPYATLQLLNRENLPKPSI
jgi:hypothetical protein